MIHHVGVVTLTPDAVLNLLAIAGSVPKLTASGLIDAWQCECRLYDLGGETTFEIVIPFGGKLMEWYQERGTTLHHVAVAVRSIDEACEDMRALRIPLISPTPVVGIAGMRVNFVHPSHCGVLLELVEG